MAEPDLALPRRLDVSLPTGDSADDTPEPQTPGPGSTAGWLLGSLRVEPTEPGTFETVTLRGVIVNNGPSINRSLWDYSVRLGLLDAAGREVDGVTGPESTALTIRPETLIDPAAPESWSLVAIGIGFGSGVENGELLVTVESLTSGIPDVSASLAITVVERPRPASPVDTERPVSPAPSATAAEPAGLSRAAGDRGSMGPIVAALLLVLALVGILVIYKRRTAQDR